MNTSTARVSAADVTVPLAEVASRLKVSPPAPAPASPTEIRSVLDGIRAMLAGCGTSDRDALLMIATAALIDAGVDTDRRIVGAAKALGFSPAHAGAVLRKSEGSDPSRHRWRRSPRGAYATIA